MYREREVTAPLDWLGRRRRRLSAFVICRRMAPVRIELLAYVATVRAV